MIICAARIFFEAAKFPTITFKTTSVSYGGGSKFTVTGLLGIRDVTKEVRLAGEIVGPAKDPWGNKRYGIVANGVINRKDFGLTWNKVLESGSLLIGEEVHISLEGEGIFKK